MTHTVYRNRILRGLNADELAVVQPHLEEVTLRKNVVLTEAGHPATHVYFPITAVLSIVGTTENGASVEVAVVGAEGVANVAAALGRRRFPFRVIAQLEGTACRVPTAVIANQLRQCRELNERFLLYSNTIIAQIGQSAICNRFHTSKQRLARWLLMTADRVESRELPMTHEFIAHMVGGPRSAVTDAAAALREAGAIDYRRGLLTIRSVPRLREQSCECYDAVQDLQRK
jgi:CRP-like cAMP-binding protein